MTERIQDLNDQTFDPYIADEAMFGDQLDPYERISELMRDAPVVRGDYRKEIGLPAMPPCERWLDHYIVLSFDAVDQVLSDPITYSNRAFEPTLAGFGRTVSVMDPPEHTRNRKILQKAFRPTIVQSWGDNIVSPVVDQLIDQFRSARSAELVDQFARPYPFNVIYRMLGLPSDDIQTFYKLTVAQIITHPTMDNALDASSKLGRYFAGLIDRARAHPGDDIVSTLVTAEVDGERLTDDVAISFLRQLINAGGDTTFRTTTSLLTGLLSNPSQLQAVRDDRSLIAQAIEEALRWDGPVIAAARETTRATEIAGVSVPAGSFLDVMYGAANHDPTVHDHPESFDIFRPKHRHFGFSFGTHNCVGQVLARLEMARALTALLDQLPNLRLDPGFPPPQMRGAMMRTPKEIRVIFD